MTKNDEFDLQDFLPYLLNQAAEASSLGFQSYYKAKYGMLQTEWRVVFHLGRYGEMTAKQICQRAQIHKTKISRAVSALEAKRFLTRTEDEKDRRQEALKLTETGTRAYRDLRQEASRFDQYLARDIPAADIDALKRCLRQISGLDAAKTQP